MNPQNNQSYEPLPEWFEPFPEPRTVPAGWDLSNLVEAERTTASARKNVAHEDGDSVRASA
ncbi:MAG TPA: hypothetical protein VII92_20690 [Anaerolineae bacterium]